MDSETQVIGYSSDEIMPPSSPLTPNISRHGRSRHGGSFTKNKTRFKGYSNVDERNWLISKTLMKVLKNLAMEDGNKETNDSWTNCEQVLAHPDISALEVTIPELVALGKISKPKFNIRLKPGISIHEDENASAYLIRINSSPVAASADSATSIELTPLNLKSLDIPNFLVYETSYSNYPLILVSGGIRRAGGQAYLLFKAISLVDETTFPSVTADVSIYIDLLSAIQANPKVNWLRSDNGAVLTQGDDEGKVDISLWRKVVARRIDIGVLYENGKVKKEIPIGLRSKGVKQKKRGKVNSCDISEIRALHEIEAMDNGTIGD